MIRFAEFEFAFVPSLRQRDHRRAWVLFEVAFENRLIPGVEADELDQIRLVLRRTLRLGTFSRALTGELPDRASSWDRGRQRFWKEYLGPDVTYLPLQPLEETLLGAEARRTLAALSVSVHPAAALRIISWLERAAQS